jgi:hypothetical protein
MAKYAASCISVLTLAIGPKGYIIVVVEHCITHYTLIDLSSLLEA